MAGLNLSEALGIGGMMAGADGSARAQGTEGKAKDRAAFDASLASFLGASSATATPGAGAAPAGSGAAPAMPSDLVASAQESEAEVAKAADEDGDDEDEERLPSSQDAVLLAPQTPALVAPQADEMSSWEGRLGEATQHDAGSVAAGLRGEAQVGIAGRAAEMGAFSAGSALGQTLEEAAVALEEVGTAAPGEAPDGASPGDAARGAAPFGEAATTAPGDAATAPRTRMPTSPTGAASASTEKGTAKVRSGPIKAEGEAPALETKVEGAPPTARSAEAGPAPGAAAAPANVAAANAGGAVANEPAVGGATQGVKGTVRRPTSLSMTRSTTKAGGFESARKRAGDPDMAGEVAGFSSTLDPRAILPMNPHVEASTAGSVKNPASVIVPTLPSTAAALEDGAGAQAVRAAEAIGHKRTLFGDAHGQMVIPELGRVEVHAKLEGASVEVRVRAQEEHTKHVIAALAPEMKAHVQVEVPNAQVHVDRPGNLDFAGFSQERGFGRDLGGRDADTHDRASKEPLLTDEAGPKRAKGARVRFVL